MKKLLSTIIAVAVITATLFTGIVTANAAGDIILTAANLDATATTATNDGNMITIGANQKAVFNLNIAQKTTYDVVIEDITSFRTLSYRVKINYGSGDVIKLNNPGLNSQPGWITFQPDTKSMTIENFGTNAMIFSNIKLVEKVFAADKPIILPSLNYDANGAAYTAVVGDNNGAGARFVAGTNYQRANIQPNNIIPYYINLAEGGEYYFLVSEKVNDNPRFIVSLDGVEKFAKTVSKSTADRDSGYSNLHYVDSIKLNQGINKIDIKVQAYTYINGFVLIRKDAVKNKVGTDLENMITAYNRDVDLYGGWTLNGSSNLTFYGNSSISFPITSELAWVIDVKRAGNYNVDFVGNYSGSNKFDFIIDGIQPYSVNFTGTGVSGETIAAQAVQLSEGIHTVAVRNYAGGVFNGLRFKMADTIKNVTLKASSFNLADGQGVGFYDTTPDKLDATYYIPAYSPCEFRHPNINGVQDGIDEAIMVIDEWMKYNVFVTETGWYDVDMTVASENAADVSIFEVSANNSAASNQTSLSTGWNDLKPLSVGKIYLKAGTNVVTVKNGRKGVNFFTDITFSFAGERKVRLVDESGNDVTEMTADNMYRAEAYLAEGDNAKLYVVGYCRGGNELATVFSVTGGTSKITTEKFTVPENVETISAFLWAEENTPLTEKLTIEVK